MRFIKHIVISVALVSSSPALAEWFEVATANGGGVWSMDFDRIKTVSGKKQAWIQVDASRDRSVSYRRSLVLISFDCTASKSRILSSIKYDSNGKVIDSRTFSDYGYGVGYDPIVPDSMIEAASKIACLEISG